MAYRSYIKRVPGFTFLGPLMIFAGMLTASDTGLIYALNPDMVLDSVSMNFAVGYFFATALFCFLLMHAGFVLYNGMVYSRYYACIVLYLCLTAVLIRVYLLGFGPDDWKIYTEIAGCILALIYLNKPQFRVRFEYKRSVWGVSLFFIWVIILSTGLYFLFRAKNNLDALPDISTVRFDPAPRDTALIPIPLSYGLKVPDNFRLSSIENTEGNLSVTFHNPDYGYIIMNNFSAITPIYKRMRILGYNNELDFTMQFFQEKVGLLPIFLRKTMSSLHVTEYDKVKVDGITLLMEKSEGDNTVAHVFRGKNLLGEVTLISISPSDTGLYNELFSTIRFREPEHDAQKLYDDASASMKNDNPEEAKRLFASAVVINPEDAEFRYMLAETFALTGYVSSAKRQLEDCLRVSPEHDRAKKLLEALNKIK